MYWCVAFRYIWLIFKSCDLDLAASLSNNGNPVGVYGWRVCGWFRTIFSMGEFECVLYKIIVNRIKLVCINKNNLCISHENWNVWKNVLKINGDKMCIGMNRNRGSVTSQMRTGLNTNRITIIHSFYNIIKLDRIFDMWL